MSGPRQLRAALGVLLIAGGCGHGPKAAPAPQPAPTAAVPRPAADTTHVAPPPDTTHPPVSAQPPAAAAAAGPPEEGRRCLLDLPNTPNTTTFRVKDLVTGAYTTYIGEGIRGKCRAQDITISADSGESYEANRLHILIGHVHYREPRIAIDADRVTYYQFDEHLLFEGNVRAQEPDSGAVMVGSRAEYYRAVAGIRTQARLVATQRPTLTYTEKDSLGRPQPPVTLNADVIVGEGETKFYASGKVVLVREDLVATGDSGTADTERHYSRLMKKPAIESRGSEPFTLHGRVIDLFGATRTLDRVLAIDSARAESKDLTMTSDTIDLRVAGSKLSRAFAFGPTGATAVTPERTIVADSLDIVMPNQRIRELRAIGKAYAESDPPDTMKVKSGERDWLRGDTIVAQFDSIPPSDTTSRPQVRDIVASGQASSFYQMPVEKGDPAKPGINYARGRVIHVEFAKGEVSTVTVQDKAAGLYLVPDTSSASRGRGRPATPAPPRKPPR